MYSSWKRHFDSSNLYLDHQEPIRFVSGPWHSGLGPPVRPLFLIYRIMLSSAFLACLLWSMIMNWDAGKWLLFLTNWGFVMGNLQAHFGTILVIQKFRSQNSMSPDSSTSDLKSETEYMPVAYKMYWVLYNVAVTAAFFITILYWTILYTPEHDLAGGFILNFAVHGFNSLLMMTDLIVGGPPSKLLHAYHPVLFTLVYIIFNLIYWAAGGKGRGDLDYIYPVLDWNNNPGLGVGIIFGGAFLLIILHTFVCCIAGIRSKYSSRRKSHVLENLGRIQPPELENGNINKGFVK